MKVTLFRTWAVLLPTIAIIGVDYARHELMAGATHSWSEQAILLAGVLLTIMATSQLLLIRLDKSRRRELEARALREIGMEITSTLELDTILSSLLQRGRQILRVDCLGVMMMRASQPELVTLTLGSSTVRRVLGPEELGFLRDSLATGESREVSRSTPALASGPCTFCSRCLAVPLKMGTQDLGVLCVGSSRSKPYSPADRTFAGEIANMASIAIANALLHEHAKNLATLEERDRIARELHDSLGQVLGYLSMKTAGALEQLRRGNVGHLGDELREIGQVADEGYLDVREAILGLRTSTHPSGGLAGALEEYLEKFSRQSGVTTHLDVAEDSPGGIAPGIEIQIVRVIQEALTNVRRHAQASNAWITMKRAEGQLHIAVRDDGRGFDPATVAAQAKYCYGLTSMRERLAAVGGQLTVQSAPGKGATISARVPLTSQEARNEG